MYRVKYPRQVKVALCGEMWSFPIERGACPMSYNLLDSGKVCETKNSDNCSLRALPGNRLVTMLAEGLAK